MSTNEFSKEQAVVWGVIAQFWVDTWYDAQQLDAFADTLASTGYPVRELDRIVHWEVCGAFATFTVAVLGTAGMCLPDWYYPEEQAIKKVAAWTRSSKLRSFLNPFWLAGYWVSRLFIWKPWRDLRSRVARKLRQCEGTNGQKPA